jgi:hypothetical protein
MNFPEFHVERLSDGWVLVIITQDEVPTTKFKLHPQSCVYLGQLLVSAVLGRKLAPAPIDLRVQRSDEASDPPSSTENISAESR